MNVAVRPVTAPPDVVVRLPGSKSLTNRALLCAALAPGRSSLTGVLAADDTRAMFDAVSALGATVVVDELAATATVTGADRRTAHSAARVDARQSGTTSRFLLPAVALGAGRATVDGGPQLRRRPFQPLLEALRQLGVKVEELGEPGHLPVRVTGPLHGGTVALPGHLSSQFLSGLLMAGPRTRDGLRLHAITPLVSVPYLDMTAAVMTHFGAAVEGLRVEPGGYRAADYAVEPDASAASYFFGAAAITGGRVTVEGLGTGSLQGDVAFVDVIERMGAHVQRSATRTTVIGPPQLRGVDVDLVDVSDTAQTLAAVAVFADTPTRVRGIGFIRGKETDRIGAVVTELKRAGVEATEHDDGFTIHPGPPAASQFETYDDHRMAMSLALLGLRARGIEIKDPECVAKTYPNFFTDLAALS